MSEDNFPLSDEEYRRISPSVMVSAMHCKKIVQELYDISTKVVNENQAIFIVLALLAEINVDVFNRMLGKESSIEEILDLFCLKLRELVMGTTEDV